MLLTLIAASIFASAQDAGPGSTPETVIFIEDIAYGQESERQRLDILHPDDVRQPRPAIVHIHSGGWYTGGKGGEKTFAMLQAFADAGYVAVSIGYRLSGEAVFPAAVEDCKLAIRWLRANADAHGIDPERIGAIGASAGGHLAAMLAATAPADGLEGKGGLDTYCSAVRAVVAVCAPLDLRRPLSLALSNEDDPLVVRFLGGSLAEKLDAARRASPINYIRKETPPIFLLHGKADKRVDMSQSIAMSEALKNAGAIHRLELIEDGKHGMDFARDEKTFQDILAFFDEHLKQGAP